MTLSRWRYLGREAALLLLWFYVILFAGTLTGMLIFPLRAASALLAAVILGSWLLLRLWRREKLPASGIEWALIVFLVAQIIALLFSEDLRRSLPHTLMWVTYFLIFFFTLDLLRRNWPAELIEKCLLITGALVLGFALFDLVRLFLSWRQFVVGLDLIPSFQQRLFNPLSDSNLLASFVNLLLPLAIARALASTSKSVRSLLVTYSVASLFVLYFTGSRGGLLGFAAALAALSAAWITVVSKPAKKRAQAIWNALWSRRVLFFTMLGLALTMIAFVAWRILRFQGDTTHGPALTARNIYWQAAGQAFRSDLLTGVGPGLYPVQLMRIWSTPPARPFLHAHNFVFQVAAESGLFGLIGLAALVFAIVRKAWRAWEKQDFAGRARWAGVTASLVGFSVHSLVDDFFPYLAIGAIIAVLLAICLYPQPKRVAGRSFSLLWLLLPALAGALLGFNGLRAWAQAEKAFNFAAQGDWVSAAQKMQDAAELDPFFAFYRLQAGYASGRAALIDSAFLKEAIPAYQQGIEKEPVYALNYANLAALYWMKGETTQALSQMRIATQLAPESWLFWLNKGSYEETLSQEEQAQTSFRRAIESQPGIGAANFWQETELRQEALASFTHNPEIEDTPLVRAAQLVELARTDISAGRLPEARAQLVEAHALNDQDASLYLALAEMAMARGEIDQAQQYVDLALWVQVTSNQSKIEAVLLGAELALARGERELALQRYRFAYEAIMAESSYGWGSAGRSLYAWFVFQRRAFPEDLLPQLTRADINTNVAERLLTLAELFDEEGKNEQAQAVAESLQPYLP